MLNKKQFYKELGRLLYAVAMSDGRVQKKELKQLHEFVSKELALFETTSDSSGMNQAFYTDFEFDKYAEQHIAVEEAHQSFIKFIEANATEIPPVLITKSVEAIEKIAGSYKLINKKERAMIDKIKNEIIETTQIL